MGNHLPVQRVFFAQLPKTHLKDKMQDLVARSRHQTVKTKNKLEIEIEMLRLNLEMTYRCKNENNESKIVDIF